MIRSRTSRRGRSTPPLGQLRGFAALLALAALTAPSGPVFHFHGETGPCSAVEGFAQACETHAFHAAAPTSSGPPADALAPATPCPACGFTAPKLGPGAALLAFRPPDPGAPPPLTDAAAPATRGPARPDAARAPPDLLDA